jgi:tRNA dimethylallyltransferase
MMSKQKLIIICGPTATGKTALAVAVAQRFGGEIVSADSMQIYRGMDIGTAKPTVGEMWGVPHHMLGCTQIGEELGAAAYREQARHCISDIASRGHLPILCGGTGLFINATVYPLDFDNAESDTEYRADLASYASQFGNEALHNKLMEMNPAIAQNIHPNNVKRVIRALEKAAQTGKSESGTQQLFNGDPLYDLAWIGLTMDRATLYTRIEARVDEMMRQGLLEEVRKLTSEYQRDSVAFQALGYKELIEYIDGKTTLEAAVAQIKTGTRNYAKRQLTWFKRENNILWFDTGEFLSRDALEEAVFGYIKASLHIS